jgi:hypothetical protein
MNEPESEMDKELCAAAGHGDRQPSDVIADLLACAEDYWGPLAVEAANLIQRLQGRQ